MTGKGRIETFRNDGQRDDRSIQGQDKKGSKVTGVARRLLLSSESFQL